MRAQQARLDKVRTSFPKDLQVQTKKIIISRNSSRVFPKMVNNKMPLW